MAARYPIWLLVGVPTAVSAWLSHQLLSRKWCTQSFQKWYEQS